MSYRLSFQGHILRATREYSVYCARCQWFEDYAPFRNQKAAIELYRELGWKKCSDGWVCPTCAAIRAQEAKRG